MTATNFWNLAFLGCVPSEWPAYFWHFNFPLCFCHKDNLMKPKFHQNIRPPGRLTPLLASIQTRQHKSQDDKAQAPVGQPFFEWLDVGVCLPAPKKQPGGMFCFCRMCNAVQQHNSRTHTYITTFVMFNMVPVYPGLVSSYGLRVIHISRACHWHQRQADDTFGTWTVHYVHGGSVQPARKHCS